jgi:histidine triad (HIT) family protein
MEDCIFCKIGAGLIPAKVVYEDADLIAIHDLHPVAPTHVLLIPKRHVDDILALAEDDKASEVMMAVLRAVPHVARQMGVAEKGFRLVNNCGEDGGQTIRHVHFHLIGGRRLGPKIV